ncbi:MAG TPA: hypothetical protein VFT06_11165 [Flavisolibacter sp.]|nr:hypothetical protein [Flavisolibacter sp.]
MRTSISDRGVLQTCLLKCGTPLRHLSPFFAALFFLAASVEIPAVFPIKKIDLTTKQLS